MKHRPYVSLLARYLTLASVAVGTGLAMTGPAVAQQAFLPELFKNDDFVTNAGLALGLILLLAILIENALAVIFNWRVFLAYVSLRGMRTPIMFAVSLAIVLSFDLDIIAELFNIGVAAGGTPSDPAPGNFLTVLLTALILSGGSAGVHNLFRNLGLRTDAEDKVREPRAPRNQAWVSVSISNLSAGRVAQVHIDDYSAPPDHNAPTNPPVAIAGTVSDKLRGPASYLFRNRNRFPQNGGYAVTPGKHYLIAVSWLDADDVTQWDYPDKNGFVFADRAIVDFDMTI